MIERLDVEPRPLRESHIVQGLFKGGVYFVQLEPNNQCGNNSRVGRIQGNTVTNNFFKPTILLYGWIKVLDTSAIIMHLSVVCPTTPTWG